MSGGFCGIFIYLSLIVPPGIPVCVSGTLLYIDLQTNRMKAGHC